MNRRKIQWILALAALLLFSPAPSHAQATNLPFGNETDYVIRDFHFKSGESLPELRIHYVHSASPSAIKTGASPTRCSSFTVPAGAREVC